MKRLIWTLVIVLAGLPAVIAQMEENGTVYIEHPAIDVIKSLDQAVVAGDSAKIAALLADDFNGYNGVSRTLDQKGTTKEKYIAGLLRWSRLLDYFSISDLQGSYPDAIRYEKDNDDDIVWVQTWDMVNGVHKKTGVKLNSLGHRLFQITNDNKIKTAIGYFNESIFKEIGESFSTLPNGTIYKNHPNINSVRKMMYSLENGDIEHSLSFYSPEVQFHDVNDEDPATTFSLGEKKNILENVLNSFDITDIEVVGYPDYLEYDLSNGRSVLSWWNIHMTRKSDEKKITLFMHLNDDFDENGKIVREISYYNRSLLEQE